MKATISPIPPPIERTVTLELSEKEALILKGAVGSKAGCELERFYGKTGFEKIVYELYEVLCKVI